MNRRSFILNTTISIIGSSMTEFDLAAQPIYGHNEKRYRQNEKWLTKNKKLPIVNDAHEMVFTHSKDILLLTNETKNNLICFDKKGKVKYAVAHDFPGGHGLTLGGVKGDDFIIITDTDLHKVFKATTDGKIITTWDAPMETGKYESEEAFIPTESVVTADGEMYVADGYGAQYIIHYDRGGKIKNIFGGRGTSDAHLDNAHGITIDYRGSEPTLLITDRNRCCFKRYTMGGAYLSKIDIPGANVCRPVIAGDYLYAAVLTSGGTGNANTGFVAILNKEDKLISTIGGSTPQYVDGVCMESYQTVQLFKHPHDVLIDDEQNLYVSQWNSGQVLPYKFEPYV
jgi:peptidylamidoglycolate lyase